MNSYSPLHLTACNREFWKRNLRKTQFIACVNPMIFLWFHLLPRNCSHDHFSRKNRRISQNEQSLGHAFPFACSWFPKNTGFAEPGLFRITGPSPDIWWIEVGEIIPRMSEYTGHYCVSRGILCFGFGLGLVTASMFGFHYLASHSTLI